MAGLTKYEQKYLDCLKRRRCLEELRSEYRTAAAQAGSHSILKLRHPSED